MERRAYERSAGLAEQSEHQLRCHPAGCWLSVSFVKAFWLLQVFVQLFPFRFGSLLKLASVLRLDPKLKRLF